MNVILEFNRKRQERDEFIEDIKAYIKKHSIMTLAIKLNMT